ncbi:MAG: hypothetical protein LBF57_03675 [Holosporaceae bacterium]|jgi:hypothetical protein|nr:hypothetical protein [Holosporaceae bacterium]
MDTQKWIRMGRIAVVMAMLLSFINQGYSSNSVILSKLNAAYVNIAKCEEEECGKSGFLSTANKVGKESNLKTVSSYINKFIKRPDELVAFCEYCVSNEKQDDFVNCWKIMNKCNGSERPYIMLFPLKDVKRFINFCPPEVVILCIKEVEKEGPAGKGYLDIIKSAVNDFSVDDFIKKLRLDDLLEKIIGALKKDINKIRTDLFERASATFNEEDRKKAMLKALRFAEEMAILKERIEAVGELLKVRLEGANDGDGPIQRYVVAELDKAFLGQLVSIVSDSNNESVLSSIDPSVELEQILDTIMKALPEEQRKSLRVVLEEIIGLFKERDNGKLKELNLKYENGNAGEINDNFDGGDDNFDGGDDDY